MGWNVKRLDEVVEIGTQLVDPNQQTYINLPHIGGDDIEKNTGRILSPKSVQESGLRSSKFHFTENHLLYCKIRPYLNKVAFPRFEGVCSADIYPLLPDKGEITPLFLLTILKTDAFLAYARIHSERLRMPKLNREQLGAYHIFLPSVEIQIIFERKAQSIFEAEQRCRIAGERLERIYSFLLHSAFSGALTAQWRDAHMKEIVAEMKEQAKYLRVRGTHSQRENVALQESLF
jgi:type I restriction enzyme S subunit